MIDKLMARLEAEAEKIGKPLDSLSGLIEKYMEEAYEEGKERGSRDEYEYWKAQ